MTAQQIKLMHEAADECMSPEQRNLFDLLGNRDADVYARLFRCVVKQAAEVQTEAVRATCEWFMDDSDAAVWSSGCGELWSFDDGGPIENSMKFCHACGKSLTVRAASSAGDQA